MLAHSDPPPRSKQSSPQSSTPLLPLPPGFLDELWSPLVSQSTRLFLFNSLLSLNDVTLGPEDQHNALENQRKSTGRAPSNPNSTQSAGPTTPEEISTLQHLIFSSLPIDLTGLPWRTSEVQQLLFRLIVNNQLSHAERLWLWPYSTLHIDQFFFKFPALNTPHYSLLTSLEKMPQLESLEVFVSRRRYNGVLLELSGAFKPSLDPMTYCLRGIFGPPPPQSNTKPNTKHTLAHLQSFTLSSSVDSYYSDLTALTSSISLPSLTTLSLPAVDLGLNPTRLDQLVEWVKSLPFLTSFHLTHRFHHTPSQASSLLSLATMLPTTITLQYNAFESSPLLAHVTSLDLDYSELPSCGPSLWALFNSKHFASKEYRKNPFRKLSLACDKLNKNLPHLESFPAPSTNSSIPTLSQAISHLGSIDCLEALTELTLIGLHIFPSAIANLTQSPLLQNLTSLSLINIVGLDSTFFPTLATSKTYLDNLMELRVVKCGAEVETTIDQLALVPFTPALEKLTLSYQTPQAPHQPVSEEPISLLFTSPSLGNLKELRFENTILSQQSIAKLAKSTTFRKNLRHFGFGALCYDSGSNLVSTLFNNSSPSPPEHFDLLKNRKYDRIFESDWVYDPENDWDQWDGEEEDDDFEDDNDIDEVDTGDDDDDNDRAVNNNNNNNDNNNTDLQPDVENTSNTAEDQRDPLGIDTLVGPVTHNALENAVTTLPDLAGTEQGNHTPLPQHPINTIFQHLQQQQQHQRHNHHNQHTQPPVQIVTSSHTTTTTTTEEEQSCFAPNLTSLELIPSNRKDHYHLAMSPHLGHLEKLSIYDPSRRCPFFSLRKHAILAANMTQFQSPQSNHNRVIEMERLVRLLSNGDDERDELLIKCWANYDTLMQSPRPNRICSLFGYPTLKVSELYLHDEYKDHKCLGHIPELATDMVEARLDHNCQSNLLALEPFFKGSVVSTLQSRSYALRTGEFLSVHRLKYIAILLLLLVGMVIYGCTIVFFFWAMAQFVDFARNRLLSPLFVGLLSFVHSMLNLIYVCFSVLGIK